MRERDFLDRVVANERFFVEACLSILDKRRELVPFKLNPAQDHYESVRSSFDFILKARKLGFSSRIIAGDLHACAFKLNQHAVLLTDSDENSTVMLEERVKPMLASCTIPLGAVERKDHLYFPSTKSWYHIGTAGSLNYGRSKDITRYHLSEFAHWKKPNVLTGVEEACVDGAVGRIETTANGANHALIAWRAAEKGDSRYRPVFVPWHLDPSYRIRGATLSVLGEDEVKLVEAYGLDQEQLAWRREKIRTMSRPELFVQEYPSNADEAFLSSGRAVFDWVSLLQHETKCAEPRWRGNLRDMGHSIVLEPSDSGQLSVWQGPEARHVYVVGADVAEGLKDGAYSAAFVYDVGTSLQVAEWHGHIPPDRFGGVLMLLGLYYNTALIAPESWPGPGGITMARLAQLGYTNLYRRPEAGGRTGDQLLGWQTTERSKVQMILSLAAAVREYELGLKSKALVSELRSYVYDEGGHMVPGFGCFSDRIIAASIAWYVSREIAAVTHYDAPKLKQIEGLVNRSSVAYVPQWRGPRIGVRPMDA